MTRWFRDQRSETTKRAKKVIRNFYLLLSGESKFKSLDEINAELQIFRPYSTEKEKAARILGAIGNSVWKDSHDHSEAEYAWLRDLVCYPLNNRVLSLTLVSW